jgi:Tfp pilus assembly pilus retraction ATPase PilT
VALLAWDRLLETCCKREATDLLLAEGSPPLIRIRDSWRSLQIPPLKLDDIRRLLAEQPKREPDFVVDGYACFTLWYKEDNKVWFRIMAFGYPETKMLVVSHCPPESLAGIK